MPSRYTDFGSRPMATRQPTYSRLPSTSFPMGDIYKGATSAKSTASPFAKKIMTSMWKGGTGGAGEALSFGREPTGRGTARGDWTDYYGSLSYWNPLGPSGAGFESTKPGRRMPDIYKGAFPGRAGMGPLTQVLADPYGGIPEDRLRASQEAVNLAVNRGGEEARQTVYGSGGAQSGAQRLGMASQQFARGADMAKAQREYEQWRVALGDSRLRSLLLPYLQTYNQAYGISAGMPQTQGTSSTTTDFLQMISPFLAMMLT